MPFPNKVPRERKRSISASREWELVKFFVLDKKKNSREVPNRMKGKYQWRRCEERTMPKRQDRQLAIRGYSSILERQSL